MRAPAIPAPHLENYLRDKRSVIGWVGTTLGAIAIGAAGFAHGKLWSHEMDLAVLKSENVLIKEGIKEQAAMLREILNRLPRTP